MNTQAQTQTALAGQQHRVSGRAGTGVTPRRGAQSAQAVQRGQPQPAGAQAVPSELLRIRNPLPRSKVNQGAAQPTIHPALLGDNPPDSQKHYQVYWSDDDDDVDVDADVCQNDMVLHQAADQVESAGQKAGGTENNVININDFDDIGFDFDKEVEDVLNEMEQEVRNILIDLIFF